MADNLMRALEALLHDDEEPVIYDLEYDSDSGFTFITIDYMGKNLDIPIELLVDDTSADRISLVGYNNKTLSITRQTSINYIWSHLLLNEINQDLAEFQRPGQWSCSLADSNDKGALDSECNITFQFVFSFPKDLSTEDIILMIRSGIDSYRSSAGGINDFIHKASTKTVDIKDVFCSNNIQFLLHPKLEQLLNDMFPDTSEKDS